MRVDGWLYDMRLHGYLDTLLPELQEEEVEDVAFGRYGPRWWGVVTCTKRESSQGAESVTKSGEEGNSDRKQCALFMDLYMGIRNRIRI